MSACHDVSGRPLRHETGTEKKSMFDVVQCADTGAVGVHGSAAKMTVAVPGSPCMLCRAPPRKGCTAAVVCV